MSSLPPDPYKILGVSKDAQIPEIRSAHRKLVLKCHPDKVQDPELKAQKQDEFQKVQQAYELLSSEKERQKYDDKVKLDELRKAMQNKANISSPRTAPKYADYEIRTAEPRPNSFKTTTSVHGGGKVYASYSRSWDDESGHGPRVEIRTGGGSRREQSYNDKPSKRESERSHRERDRDVRDREKERERDLRRRREREEEDRREAERAAKEIRRAEKKRLEKLATKAKSRETSDKSRHKSPYIEENDEYVVPRSEKKKSSSKKHEEKVERPVQREDPVMPPPDRETYNLFNAASYIERAGGAPSLQRSATTYHVRNTQPPAPTPPPAQGVQSAFPTPDDDDVAHRSSAAAKIRRGSSDTVKSARSHKKSREFAEDPIIMDASPQTARGSPKVRPTAQFQHANTTTPMVASSPPRSGLGRSGTMPVDGGYTRPAPGMTRASTFSYGESQAGPRGRSRSRMQPQQIDEEESDSDYEYERRREQKHRGKKTRSPAEMPRASENVRYQVNEGRTTKIPSSYSRPVEPEYYYAEPAQHSRPTMARDVSYVSGGAALPKVKMSKAYSYQDVQYSDHYNSQPYHRDEYAY